MLLPYVAEDCRSLCSFFETLTTGHSEGAEATKNLWAFMIRAIKTMINHNLLSYRAPSEQKAGRRRSCLRTLLPASFSVFFPHGTPKETRGIVGAEKIHAQQRTHTPRTRAAQEINFGRRNRHARQCTWYFLRQNRHARQRTRHEEIPASQSQ